jgi:hypothetical protein
MEQDLRTSKTSSSRSSRRLSLPLDAIAGLERGYHSQSPKAHTLAPIIICVLTTTAVNINDFMTAADKYIVHSAVDANVSSNPSRTYTITVDRKNIQIIFRTDDVPNAHAYIVLFDLLQQSSLDECRDIIDNIYAQRRPSIEDTMWVGISKFPIFITGINLSIADNLIDISENMALMVKMKHIANKIMICHRNGSNINYLAQTIVRTRWQCEEDIKRHVDTLLHGATLLRSQSDSEKERCTIS